MQLSDAIDRFETSLQAAGRSPHTIGSYLSDVRRLESWIADADGGGRPLGSIDVEQLEAFVASDRVLLKADGTPKAPGSVNKLRASLRAFFTWLVDAGCLTVNPARTLRLRPATSAPPEILTPAEQRLLLETIRARKGAIAERDRVVFEVFLGTGIRLSSLVTLDVEDIRLDDKRMLVTVKGGRREAVFIKSELRRLLRGHIRRLRRAGDDTGPLFRSTRGTRICTRQVQGRLGYWLGEAGIGKAVTIHGLRHTFGSRLYARTRDLRLVQRALGHRHVTTTQIYVQLADDVLEDALEGM